MNSQNDRRSFIQKALLLLGASYLLPSTTRAEQAPATGPSARERWNQLSEEEKKLLRQRWQEFQNLTPEQQQRIRDNYQKFRRLSPEKQNRVRARMRKLRQMSPERRNRLKQKWRARRSRAHKPSHSPRSSR